MEDRIVICIPTRRPPPVITLGSYSTSPYNVFVVAAPEVYEQHYEFYKGIPGVKVKEGVVGLGAQCGACYRHAFQAGYPLWFKMDDDLPQRTFVHIDGSFPLLPEVIISATHGMDETRTTLVGFQNTTRRDWMDDGYGRTYGHIHGGANLSISAEDSREFIDDRIVRGEDIYRTCAHRLKDGAVGRVKFIGFDKKKSTMGTTTTPDRALLDQSRDIILERFSGLVAYEGPKELAGGRIKYEGWRMKRK
jgi:hypothetical protein